MPSCTCLQRFLSVVGGGYKAAEVREGRDLL